MSTETAAANQDNDQDKQPRTKWHRILAKLLELLLTTVGITVQPEVPITSDPPKVDILLLRREQPAWTATQLALLCDGLRDTAASHLLIEFKFSESFNAAALLQALSYDYFYRQSQQLPDNAVQTFVMVSMTPQRLTLQRFGFTATELPGIYHSMQPLVERIVLIVLNQLRPLPYNAFVQTFASRSRIRQQAFATVDGIARGTLSERLLELLFGLRRQLAVQEAGMNKQILPEGITPEYIMKLGREVRMAVVETLTPEEMAALPPEKRLAGMAIEDRLAGLAPEDRLAGLTPEELAKLMEQVERFLHKQQNQDDS